jgi:hypothetical protein
MQVWREGGYSDDMMLAAYCVDNGLSIGLPASSLFPQLLPPTTTWHQYWNYLRRQLFVLDTYYNEANRMANHTLMLLHSYGSAVFIIAVTAVLLQLLLLAAMAAAGGCCMLSDRLGFGVQGSGGVGGLVGCSWGVWGLGSMGEVGRVLVGAAGWVCRGACGGGSSGNSSVWEVVQGAAAEVATPGLYVFIGCVFVAQISIWFMSRQCLRLMQELAPPGVWSSGRGPDRHGLLQSARVSYSMLWAGWVLENAVLPACMFYSFASDWITWGGIRYEKEDGKVVSVKHPGR